jgi:tRNA (guanine-N7-)-methyltransferase
MTVSTSEQSSAPESAIRPERLPIFHPEYRYPRSLNIYADKNDALKGRIYSDNDTESHRGQWRKAFPERLHSPSTELHLEIGCNAGHVTVEWAKQNPARAYIGLDWKFKAIHRGAEKALKRGIDNLIFFRAHAIRLKYMFAENELDQIAIYFPDPWPKKAHWKNRYINESQLKDLHHVLKPGGVLHIKTDHRGYFDWMEEAIAKTSSLWEVRDRTTDLHAGNPAPEKLEIPNVTLFEKLFIKDGIQINSVRLIAKKDR